MGTYLLHEELGTKFIYKSQVDNMVCTIKELIDKDAHGTIDICYTHYTPDAARELEDLIAKSRIRYIDSSSEVRNKLLKYNCSIRRILDSEEVVLPDDIDVENIRGYLERLDPELIYNIPLSDYIRYIPLTVLVLLTRPSIQINLGKSLKDMVKFINKKLFIRDPEEFIITADKKFKLVVATNVYDFETETINTNEYFYVPSLGRVTWNTLISKYEILPEYFGNVNVYSDKRLLDVWSPVIDEIMERLTKNVVNTNMTLHDFLIGNIKENN